MNRTATSCWLAPLLVSIILVARADTGGEYTGDSTAYTATPLEGTEQDLGYPPPPAPQDPYDGYAFFYRFRGTPGELVIQEVNLQMRMYCGEDKIVYELVSRYFDWFRFGTDGKISSDLSKFELGVVEWADRHMAGFPKSKANITRMLNESYECELDCEPTQVVIEQSFVVHRGTVAGEQNHPDAAHDSGFGFLETGPDGQSSFTRERVRCAGDVELREVVNKENPKSGRGRATSTEADTEKSVTHTKSWTPE